MTEQVDTLRTQLHTFEDKPYTNHTQQNYPAVPSTQSYTERTQLASKDSEKAPDINIEEARVSGLSARKLGERLGLSHVTLGRKVKKGADVFATWIKQQDPNGLAWELRGDKYYPLPSETGNHSY